MVVNVGPLIEVPLKRTNIPCEVGGESRQAQVPRFCRYYKSYTVFVEFSTNASRTLRYWEQFRTHRAFCFLSWHNEFVHDDASYEVAKIMQHKASVAYPMITPDNFDLAKDLYYRLTDLNVEIIQLARTSIEAELFNYTDEQREWIQNNAWHK